MKNNITETKECYKVVYLFLSDPKTVTDEFIMYSGTDWKAAFDKFSQLVLRDHRQPLYNEFTRVELRVFELKTSDFYTVLCASGLGSRTVLANSDRIRKENEQ